MKQLVFYISFALLILFQTILNTDTSLTSARAEDAKEVKKEFGKTNGETKDAITREVKTIKEQVPKDVREIKKELIKKKDVVKTGAKQDLKEIRENLKKPIKPSETEQKK